MDKDARLLASLEAGSALARQLFDAMGERTADPPGVTRVAYGEGEREAFAMVAAAGRRLSAAATFDAAGNQFITLPGRDAGRTIYIGSHLDSVPHGGNFDGAAGVLIGMAALSAFAQMGEEPPFNLCVLCLRAEESCWFPHSYIGSKTALGRLDPSVLDTVRRSDTGLTLAEHMRDEGFDPEAVRKGRSIIDPGRTVAYLEPHIEQAPVLLTENIPIGLVTGIRGSFRYREAICHGAYAHSGATPRALRQDAVVASAELVMAMQSLWEGMEAAGHDLAVTFGMFGTDAAQHSFSKVAGETNLCLDVRSQDEATLAEVRDRIRTIVEEIGERRKVRFELGPMTGSMPALMSKKLIGQLERAASERGIGYKLMASGAGHDAATFAQAGIDAGMIFIRNENGSHNPDEWMEMADFDRTLALVVAWLMQPSESWA